MVQKAIAEAKKVGEVIVAASSKDKNYTSFPTAPIWTFRKTPTMSTSARTKPSTA